VFCLAHVAVPLWLLGYPDQALQRSHEALTLAQELVHPFSLTTALNWGAELHQLRREWPRTREQAEALVALAREQGFAERLATSLIMHGWALAEQGHTAEAIAQMRQGICAARDAGREVKRPYSLALLAEACGKAGEAEEGLRLLAEALEIVQATEERYYEAELHRLQGELLLARGPEHQMEAESCFHHALDIARRQSAKSLELRAAVSLSRLWQRQGNRDAPRQLLGELYSWFTEGFDTLDLQEAQALLGELS